MQQELESIQAELAGHKARLEEVRAGIHDAKASNNREEWQQLQALELELLRLINKLSSQSAAAAAAAAGDQVEELKARVTALETQLGEQGTDQRHDRMQLSDQLASKLRV
jgi:predicted RecB family endonuclease